MSLLCAIALIGVPSGLHGNSPSNQTWCVSGGCGHVSGHVEAGDQRARAHLPLRVHVGHFAHHEETAPDLHEVALVAEPLEVGATTEQCA